MEPQKTQNSQNNLEKVQKSGGVTLPDFKLHYKAIVLKQYSSICHKNRNIDYGTKQRAKK